jgi:hypothetical protein
MSAEKLCRAADHRADKLRDTDQAIAENLPADEARRTFLKRMAAVGFAVPLRAGSVRRSGYPFCRTSGLSAW